MHMIHQAAAAAQAYKAQQDQELIGTSRKGDKEGIE
jgi:hypothetical protein